MWKMIKNLGMQAHYDIGIYYTCTYSSLDRLLDKQAIQLTISN